MRDPSHRRRKGCICLGRIEVGGERLFEPQREGEEESGGDDSGGKGFGALKAD